jgi:phospholipase A1
MLSTSVLAQPEAVPEGPMGGPSRGALAGCAELESEAARLECYDTVLGVTPSERTAPPVADAEPGQPPVPPPSAMARRWQYTAQTERGPFVITPYRPTYVLPVSYNARPNEQPYQGTTSPNRDLDRTEIKFQFSFKTKVWPELLSRRGDLWFAYTQTSYWQAYSKSSPFRETNYEPEFIYSYRTSFRLLGLQGRLLTLGLNHQSNGLADPLSRSWNRIVAGALFDQGDWALQVRGWWRIPESESDDDNPGIVDTVGRGEIWGFWQHEDHTLGIMLRSNFDPTDPKGALRVDYSIPLGGPVKAYLQGFYGYGDGLIDYDHISARISIGLMLIDWM